MTRWLTLALLMAVCLQASPAEQLPLVRVAAPQPHPRSTPPVALAWEPAPDDQVDAIFAPTPRRWPAKLSKGDLNRGAARAAGELLREAPEEVLANCTRFVQAAYATMGARLTGGVGYMWERAERANAVHFDPRPEPGDIAFFDDTFDSNRNGRIDDPLTHVAIVVSVEPDGDIWMAHGGTRGASKLFRMYLGDDPSQSPGDMVRVPRDSDPPEFSTLARDLWRGFARVRRPDLAVWGGQEPEVVADEGDLDQAPTGG